MIKNGIIYCYYFAQLMVINMVDEGKKRKGKKSLVTEKDELLKTWNLLHK